ncbi:MAG: chorismate lyase [Gammaproteobacteria bacterium]|nr:chorismate lyase [Gammaproteobacteria bacterium]
MFKSTTTLVMPENRWLSLFEFQQTQPEVNQLSWLSEQGSMTRQLMMAGANGVKVDVIAAKHQRVAKEERLFLDLPQNTWPYVREVIMSISDKPWMYGRTVIPSRALDSAGGRLKMIGDEPLGKILFSHENSRRLIEIAKISGTHHLFPVFKGMDAVKYLWARRSLFEFQKQPILVQEVFLPNCPLQIPE